MMWVIGSITGWVLYTRRFVPIFGGPSIGENSIIYFYRPTYG